MPHRDLTSMVGRQFGLLRVVREGERIGRTRTWLCRCACGQTVQVRHGNLVYVRGTRSCGCARGNHTPRPMGRRSTSKGRPCTLCAHPQRKAIERALKLAMPMAGISKKFHVGESVLSNHRSLHMKRVPVNRQGGHGRPVHQFKLAGSQPRQDREPTGGSGMDMVVLHVWSEAAVPFRTNALIDGGRFRTDGDVLKEALFRGLAALERECRPLPPTVETGRPAFPVSRPPRAGDDYAEVASEAAM